MQSIQLIQLTVEDLEQLINNAVCKAIQRKENQVQDDQKDIPLTMEQAAEMIGISDNTLRKYSKQGLIKRYKEGNRVIYMKSDIENFINDK